jgi:N-acetylneuraminic acid mutarotase
MKAVALLWTLSAAAAAGWHDLPALPQALGGQTAGVSHGALLVVGGSRFDRPPYDGGTREWMDTLHVLAPGAAAWRTFPMGAPRAYACAVSYQDSVYVVGGANAEGALASVLRIEWQNGRPSIEAAPALPHALTQHGCALSGSRLYVLGGLTTVTGTTASASLLMLDLADRRKGWSELEPLPAAGRILPACGVLGSAFYVFGGAELGPGANGQPVRRYRKDAWRYEVGQGWRAAAPLPRPVVAAPAVAISPAALAVFGGDDGALDGRAAELRERHPGFSRSTLVYDAGRDVWTEGPALPVGLVTTAAVHWQSRIVIPGGEDRPGHRSARVPSIEGLRP